MKHFLETIKRNRGESIVTAIVSMVLVVGTLSLFVTWFVLNANEFQMQTALNRALKQAQVDGYVTTANITTTKAYLANVGLASADVQSPQTSGPVAYGAEIQITIVANSMELPTMDRDGHAVTGSRAIPLTATGFILSQKP